ncbi:MAG TPA: SpoIID/LytB domain-containing protein [Blastocatellia bacterium]|nr:SpoIID/LytB domain-containing protein [Blastocatellia bacterium]
MDGLSREPTIRVGILSCAHQARFSLKGPFVNVSGDPAPEGYYACSLENGAVRLQGAAEEAQRSVTFTPTDFATCRITIEDVTIGIDFHWERKEAQQFQGALIIRASDDGLTLINELPIESYLVSVVSSEMSASCPAELLRAHAVVSRSWLLAQLNERDKAVRPRARASYEPAGERIRWYDRESHSEFDVCADDHCQRYQGISKAFSKSAFEALQETRGKVLQYGDEICDARYSKSCGGMTEVYSAAWEERDVPYLVSIYDGPGEIAGFNLPLSVEANAEAWIASRPPAYCDARAEDTLSRILPGFDQETKDFYRWQVSYTRDELREILSARLGVDFGRIEALEPVERGQSGRIIRLRIRGERETLLIGKELEVRRALSRSHLYSSAFIVRQDDTSFHLIGAGWGHGVGLCQIGAAVMADRGVTHEEILAHYFKGARIRTLY